MKRKEASSLVYLISFFVVFFAFAAFAVDATIVYTARAKLQSATEIAALSGASGLTPNSRGTGATVGSVQTLALEAFGVFKPDGLESATATVDVNLAGKKVRVTSVNLCQPYFLALLGVSGIRINAVAVAASEMLTVATSYAGVNWVSDSAAYFSDVISALSASLAHIYKDTAILKPIGDYPSSSLDSSTGDMRFNYLAKGDSIPLSLGPGGFITMKLPAPIINKPGSDLFIKEMGDSLEGYFLFVGLDVDPGPSIDNGATTGPYLNANKPGSGIRWKNISCSGTPEKTDTSNGVGAYDIATTNLGVQTKFYGSGYFDIGANCSGLSMAKYIRIIDDNDETAFVKNSDGSNSGTYYKARMYGESSTITSGADIDYVDVLNHVRLLAPSAW